MPQRAPVLGNTAATGRRIAYDAGRGSAAARGYDRKWRKVRALHLQHWPLCADCIDEGKLTPATEVDHVQPIETAPHRRLDPTNLRSQCHPHHMLKTARDKRDHRPRL